MAKRESAGYYAQLGAALLTPPPDDPEAEQDYYRLFLSPQGAPCPPWQSVYLDVEGETPRLMGVSHHSALEWYRRYGFEPAAGTEPADHAGLLLLFYAKLIDTGVDDSVLAEYERQHVRWLPRLAEKMARHARTEVFRGLAAELSGCGG